MSDSDVLVELLARPETGTGRKPQNTARLETGNGGDTSGYDLTNPNLHHGVDDVYRPVPSSEQLRSSAPTDGAASAMITEDFQPLVGDQGPIAEPVTDQSSHEDPTSSLDISNHVAARAAGDVLTVSGSLSSGPGIDAHTDIIPAAPTNEDFGNHPVTTATNTQGVTVSDSLVLQVIDNAPAITSDGGGATASVNVAENATAVTTVTATDADCRRDADLLDRRRRRCRQVRDQRVDRRADFRLGAGLREPDRCRRQQRLRRHRPGLRRHA